MSLVNNKHPHLIEFPDYASLSLHNATMLVIREKILNEYRKYKCSIPRIKDYRFKKLFQNIKDIDPRNIIIASDGKTLHHIIKDDLNIRRDYKKGLRYL